MTENTRRNRPDLFGARETILANRRDFVTYNITRLREVIRHLSRKKLELFHTIPLLLHVNSPDLPGYVDHPQTPHGIYGFFDSGFWMLAKKRLGIEIENIRSYISKSFLIKGIYLIGSTGTVGQTDISPFDYWIVIDSGSVSEAHRGLLSKKLGRIEEWAKQTYDQLVTFFLLDFEQIRQSDFCGIDEEHLGAAQRSLLKEEFYRTFILIGGQIPYWAVLPARLKDAEYKSWVETASLLSEDNSLPDDYVDLGNLTAIKSEDFLDALLWQVWDAQNDPVKSLIKASLTTHHCFFQEKEGLLCDIIKERFFEGRLDSCHLDPYVFAFEKALAFYESMDDEDGLELVKQCICLRLVGYPVPSELDENNRKAQVLRDYVDAWSWADDQMSRLVSYGLWPEKEKLRLEKRIIDKLWFLYQLVSSSTGESKAIKGVPIEDLSPFKRRIRNRFEKKPGKIPRCSASLRVQGGGNALFVAHQRESSDVSFWAVYSSSVKSAAGKENAHFVAPELLRILGWIIFNGLYEHKTSAVALQFVQGPISRKLTRGVLDELFSFFPDQIPPLDHTSSDPRWLRVFVALDTSRFAAGDTLRSVDYLVQNTWGEMFFYSLDLTHIESNLLKCHEIAKQVWRYLQTAGPGEASYRIYDLRTVEDASTTRSINSFIKSFQKTGIGDHKAQESERKDELEPDETERAGNEPLLDLF
ncbi:MAG: class I adenylate cyclase [Desulfobacteraceae bacterium]|nr:class I adenylate cyclase [Desulfobacteraceae bacterium]